ncbi:MAG: 4Fe-4S dicluster domain-containing protein [Lentimicrobium sp.]|nr:4Fe-4S dicluster domain-containing protein [Lentimicrobium sp.]
MIEDKTLKINPDPLFGCIGCGHCVAVCPHDAIMVEGRTLATDDYSPIDRNIETTGFDQLYRLLLNRCSILDFKDKPVTKEML